MKTCPACGNDYDDLLIFCEEDGALLVGADIYREQQAPPARLDEAATLPLAQPTPPAEESVSLHHCPACAAEYPLTFTKCPVDGVPLAARAARPRATPHRTAAARPVTDLAPEHRFATIPFAGDEVEDEPAEEEFEGEFENEFEEAAPAAPMARVSYDEEPPDEEPARADDGRGFRLAARALAAFIVAVGLMGLFLLLSPERPPVETANAGLVGAARASQPSVFVPTPPLADAENEASDETVEAPPEPDIEPRPERPPARLESSDSEIARPKNERPRPGPREETRRAAARAAESATPARVDARLVRVRSRKSPQGMRYDLTFTLQEKNGRPIRWERLAINARARSGRSAARTIPFPRHSGGPSRATFTVTADMPGRTAADWRGHINFTGMGRDAAGRPVRAAFGTSVAP